MNRNKDLVQCLVREALAVLDQFLDANIAKLNGHYRNSNLRLKVIPGKGMHSPNGIPKIKPAVKKRLEDREHDRAR